MTFVHYGFIVLAPDYKAQQQCACLDNGLFKTEIVGVSSVEEAIEASRKLISAGVQLIELCGGFGEENANRLIAALDTDTPIGFVGFSSREMEKLNHLLHEK